MKQDILQKSAFYPCLADFLIPGELPGHVIWPSIASWIPMRNNTWLLKKMEIIHRLSLNPLRCITSPSLFCLGWFSHVHIAWLANIAALFCSFRNQSSCSWNRSSWSAEGRRSGALIIAVFRTGAWRWTSCNMSHWGFCGNPGCHVVLSHFDQTGFTRFGIFAWKGFCFGL